MDFGKLALVIVLYQQNQSFRWDIPRSINVAQLSNFRKNVRVKFPIFLPKFHVLHGHSEGVWAWGVSLPLTATVLLATDKVVAKTKFD